MVAQLAANVKTDTVSRRTLLKITRSVCQESRELPENIQPLKTASLTQWHQLRYFNMGEIIEANTIKLGERWTRQAHISVVWVSSA